MTDIVSDVINACVAIGTIAMAVYTRQTVEAAKKSIDDTNKALEAANRTARATEENAERMKDALIPFLDLSVRIAHPVESNGSVVEDSGFYLIMRNNGMGPAIIRAFTMREDIRDIRPWELIPVSKGIGTAFEDEQSSDLAIGPGETFTFLFKYRKDRYSDQDENLSSLSVFYEDLYGRTFRSRLVYIFRQSDGQNQAISLNREHLSATRIPDLSMAGFGQREEGGPPCTYVSLFQSLHLLAFVKRTLGTHHDGDIFTGNRPVRVNGVRFGFDGFPIIDVQVDGCPEFSLESYRSQGQRRNVRILSKDGSLPGTFNTYGLVPNGSDDQRNLLMLYQKLCGLCADVPLNILSYLFT